MTETTNQPPFLTDAEIAAIRAPGDIPTMLPPRCYYSEEIYHYEVEKIFRRNWLVVGRWDQVENSGDYFTLKLFGEPYPGGTRSAGRRTRVNQCLPASLDPGR